MQISQLLSEITSHFNSCVLRNWDDLRSEIDIFVEKKEVNQVIDLIHSKVGEIHITRNNNRVSVFSKKYKTDFDLQFFLVGGKGFSLLKTKPPEFETYKNFKILPKTLVIPHLICHCLIDKAGVDKYIELFSVSEKDLDIALSKIKISRILKCRIKYKIINKQRNWKTERFLWFILISLNPVSLFTLLRGSYHLHALYKRLK